MLSVLFWGLKASPVAWKFFLEGKVNRNFWSKKDIKIFFSCTFFFGHRNPGSGFIWNAGSRSAALGKKDFLDHTWRGCGGSGFIHDRSRFIRNMTIRYTGHDGLVWACRQLSLRLVPTFHWVFSVYLILTIYLHSHPYPCGRNKRQGLDPSHLV